MKNNLFIILGLSIVLNLWSINADALEHLCDRWNVLLDSGYAVGPIYGELWTDRYKLLGDTIINNTHYSCLWFEDGRQTLHSESGGWIYNGALRETTNAEIFFIPEGQSKEYLLFAFNVEVGDKIENIYVMNRDYSAWAIVKEISGSEIILDLYEQFAEREDIFLHDYVWVKGIGSKRSLFQPLPNGEVGGNVVNFLLCAYNGEEQIYVSDTGDEYGCEYRQKPAAIENINKSDIHLKQLDGSRLIIVLPDGRQYDTLGRLVKE